MVIELETRIAYRLLLSLEFDAVEPNLLNLDTKLMNIFPR